MLNFKSVLKAVKKRVLLDYKLDLLLEERYKLIHDLNNKKFDVKNVLKSLRHKLKV